MELGNYSSNIIKIMEFKLTIEELNLILAGLSELPAKMSMPLILKLQAEGQRQFEEQNNPEKEE